MFAHPRRLPQELADMIIGHTRTRAEWRQCALVCRSWTRASQAQIFRGIHISLVYRRREVRTNVSLPRRLHELLLRSPCLARHVRDISIVFEGLRNASLRTDQQLLAIVLPKFHRLMRISITCQRRDAFDFETSLLEALRAIISSPQMRHVSLAGFCELEDLAPIISLMGTTLTSLTSLELMGTTICNPSTTVFPPKGDGPPVVIESLDVRYFLVGFSGWFSMLQHPLVVKKLSLEGYEDASSLLTVLAPGLEDLDFYPNKGPRWVDLSSLHQLSKLTMTLDDNLNRSLKTIGEGNCLERLELHIFHTFEDPEFASSIRSLDELLSTPIFAPLRSVIFPISMDFFDLPGVDEFRIFKKNMWRSIGRGILQLCLSDTGEIIDSEQIRTQAAFYEVCYPTDFPWFMDILEEVEEEEEEEVAHCTEGSESHFTHFCTAPCPHVSMNPPVARMADPVVSSLPYASSAPTAYETPPPPLPYTTTATIPPQHLPQAPSPPLQSQTALYLNTLLHLLKLPPPDVSGDIFPLDLIASVASTFDFPIPMEHATQSSTTPHESGTGGMSHHDVSHAPSRYHDGAEATNWAVQAGFTHSHDAGRGLLHCGLSSQYNTYPGYDYNNRGLRVEGNRTSEPVASLSSNGYFPNPMYVSLTTYRVGNNNGANDASSSSQVPYAPPHTLSAPTPPRPGTHREEVIDASGMTQSPWYSAEACIPFDSFSQSTSLYNPAYAPFSRKYYATSAVERPVQLPSHLNHHIESHRYPTTRYLSENFHHPSPEPYLENLSCLQPPVVEDYSHPPVIAVSIPGSSSRPSSGGDSSSITKAPNPTCWSTNSARAITPHSSSHPDSPHKGIPLAFTPSSGSGELDYGHLMSPSPSSSTVSLARIVFPPGLIAEIASTMPDF